MKHSFNKEKLITILILPLMWLAYFLFELFTGRINSTYDFILNFSLTFIFILVGLLIYRISSNHSKGFSNKLLIILFFILMIIDQGIKFIIKLNFFNCYFEVIPNFLFFKPIINNHGSWLNARFDLTANFPLLITMNFIFIFVLVELFRYAKNNNIKSFWSDMAFIFTVAGALCSLIDKIFYGGSLDFIGISNLFIADIKDIYIHLGLLFFIVFIFKSDYLKDDNNSFKDDLKAVKKFLLFIKSDIMKKK